MIIVISNKTELPSEYIGVSFDKIVFSRVSRIKKEYTDYIVTDMIYGFDVEEEFDIFPLVHIRDNRFHFKL